MSNDKKFPFTSVVDDDATSSQNPLAGVACRGGLAIELVEDSGRIQLFPAGYFAASDGRPGNLKGIVVKTWRMLDSDAEKVIAGWKQKTRLTVIDYEHQTLHSETNGQPAPAAGWITDLVWESDSGLYAKVNWTQKARNYIKNGEYRYISPVFNFDPKTGAVTSLHSAALTNNPALDGMMEVKARENFQPGENMDKELLAALAAFFALKPDATEEDVKTALADQKPLAEQLAAKDSEIAALKEASDPAKFAPMELVEAQTTQIASLTKKLSDLEKKTEETGLDAEITAALADGRLPKSCEGWARKMATERPSALREFLKVSVAPAALTNMQTNGQHISDEGVASLTEDEKFACRVTGVSEEDFLAQKKKEAK